MSFVGRDSESKGEYFTSTVDHEVEVGVKIWVPRPFGFHSK